LLQRSRRQRRDGDGGRLEDVVAWEDDDDPLGGPLNTRPGRDVGGVAAAVFVIVAAAAAPAPLVRTSLVGGATSFLLSGYLYMTSARSMERMIR
jgi:hypothetical protein